MPILENTVEINGQTINKERFGMAAYNDNNKTFTGEVLFTSQKSKNGGWSQSIEEKFEDALEEYFVPSKDENLRPSLRYQNEKKNK